MSRECKFTEDKIIVQGSDIHLLSDELELIKKMLVGRSSELEKILREGCYWNKMPVIKSMIIELGGERTSYRQVAEWLKKQLLLEKLKAV
jgi:hypothetical protein